MVCGSLTIPRQQGPSLDQTNDIVGKNRALTCETDLAVKVAGVKKKTLILSVNDFRDLTPDYMPGFAFIAFRFSHKEVRFNTKCSKAGEFSILFYLTNIMWKVDSCLFQGYYCETNETDLIRI